MNKYKDFEQDLIEVESLLDVIKEYCHYKSEESDELSNLSVLMDMICDKQKSIFCKFDKIYLENFL